SALPAVTSRRLLVYGARCPRGLPPFPTRRSSDLDRQAVAAAQLRCERACGARDRGRPFGRLRDADDQPLRTPVADDRVDPGPGRDRKSTRLNSSHVKISYAVFCLKKNTTDNIAHI